MNIKHDRFRIDKILDKKERLMISISRTGLLLLLAVSFIACASTKQSSAPIQQSIQNSVNKLTAVEIRDSESRTDVVLRAAAKPAFSIFRMSEPQRIVVDMQNTMVEGPEPIVNIDDGMLSSITTNQFKESNKQITRVMLIFEENTDFTVTEGDREVVLHLVHKEGFSRKSPVADKPETESNISIIEAKDNKQNNVDGLNKIKAQDEEPEIIGDASVSSEPVIMCDADNSIVLEEYKGEKSSSSLKSVKVKLTKDSQSKGEMVKVQLNTTSAIKVGSYEVIRLCEPERMVVDLYGVKNKSHHRKFKGDGEYVSQVRLGRHKDKLRLVFDLLKPLPEFDIISGKKSTVISMSPASTDIAPAPIAKVQTELPEDDKQMAADVEIEKASVNESKENKEINNQEVMEVAAQAEVKVETGDVKQEEANDSILGLDFRHKANSSTIEIKLSRPAQYELTQSGENQITLMLKDVKLPENLEQSLDTSEFNGPISLISSYTSDVDKNIVKVAVQTIRPAQTAITTKDDNTLVWEFEDNSVNTVANTSSGHIELNKDGQTIIEYAADESAGAYSQSSVYNASTAAKAQGQRISLELKDTNILDVLRLIADVSKLNIIASDDVSGSVTVRLLNVPWQQALDIILRSKGLGKERQGNIIRVAPLSVLQNEREMRINQIKAQRELEPLSVRLIPVSYSEAGSLVAKIKDLLSPRGTVNFDERTNVIIVKDIDEVLAKAEGLIAKLDLQTPQVMIEAKIVEADVNNSYGFGIQWGGYFSMSEATGNPTGLAFPYSFGMSGAMDGTAMPGVGDTSSPNWVVNLPATTQNSAMGFTFGNASNSANLSLRLSAAEASGKVKIVSSPRISTLDNKEASIMQGLRIPIMSLTISGTPVSKMIQAKLELKVTPHISADGSIMMKIEIKKEEPDFSRTNALGDPAIITKEAKTEVLVRTGETTVIGGIYTKKDSLVEAGTPGLYKIPVLGWLFKSRTKTMEKTELLIFVTPRIINRSQSTLTME